MRRDTTDEARGNGPVELLSMLLGERSGDGRDGNGRTSGTLAEVPEHLQHAGLHACRWTYVGGPASEAGCRTQQRSSPPDGSSVNNTRRKIINLPTTTTTRAWLSLGSNVEPEHHLRAALDELRARFGQLRVSPVYRTPAVGFEGPDFLNLAVALDSDLEPLALNDWLHALEDRHGRRRDVPRFSSRTLDVDIVLFGERVLAGPGNLELPRGELVKHAFVLRPMADIGAELVHPLLGRTLAQLWRDFPRSDAREATTLAPPL